MPKEFNNLDEFKTHAKYSCAKDGENKCARHDFHMRIYKALYRKRQVKGVNAKWIKTCMRIGFKYVRDRTQFENNVLQAMHRCKTGEEEMKYAAHLQKQIFFLEHVQDTIERYQNFMDGIVGIIGNSEEDILTPRRKKPRNPRALQLLSCKPAEIQDLE